MAGGWRYWASVGVWTGDRRAGGWHLVYWGDAWHLDMSYKQVLTLRHRLQQHLDESAPTAVMQGDEFEVDELYQNAGEKKHPPP